MYKELYAVEFDGTTFAMDVKTDTEQYKRFKESIQSESFIDVCGKQWPKCKVFTVPYMKLAAIMRDAHWLVSEEKYFNKITIDRLRNGEEIFVKYDDELIDFRKRRSINFWGENMKS